jgi:hypothetical protein
MVMKPRKMRYMGYGASMQVSGMCTKFYSENPKRKRPLGRTSHR